MSKLYLQRHLKSQWNVENRFAGWVDNPISREGSDMALEASKLFINEKFDVIFTSPLARNQQTVIRILRNFDKTPLFVHLDGGKMQEWGNFDKISENCVPVFVSEKLNERYYGKLQGLNKKETAEKYGKDLVQQWRRSYKIAPPEGESMEDTFNRVIPFYKEKIEKDLKENKNVLVVASHNSLRAIVKYINNINDEDISNLELPFGSVVKYDFDGENYSPLQ